MIDDSAGYIVLHDTALFAFSDENVEYYPRYQAPTRERPGLWPAVVDFLVRHPEWYVALRCFNNNGLTVLRRSESSSRDAEVRQQLHQKVQCHTSLNNSLASVSPMLYAYGSRYSLAVGWQFEQFLKNTLQLALSHLKHGVPHKLALLLWRDLVQCCAILARRVEQGRPTFGMDPDCEPSKIALLGSDVSRRYGLLPSFGNLLDEFGS